MTQAYRLLSLLLALVGLAKGSAAFASTARPKAELEKIILHSRHLGAHGLGYNDSSLLELAHTLTPADIPNLISLLDETGLRVGAEFALASQCDAAIKPVQEAAAEREEIAALDADDIMELIAGFSGCAPEVQAKARTTRIEIDIANKEWQAKRMKEIQEKAAEDARIQNNGLKMTDPTQRKTLTRAEREEVFRRSVKAAGLENPQTPAQKALVDRMYRTMVLDEPSEVKKQ